MAQETDDRDPTVYATLAEAAEDVGKSPDELRRAVHEREIVGIKENPRNKRSRWLVSLDSVRRRYGIIRDDEGHNGDLAEEDAVTEEAVEMNESAVTPIRSGQVDNDVTETHMTLTDARRTSVEDAGDGSMAIAPLVRGEVLIERLSSAIDRFAEAIPEPSIDQQALLDRYLEAVDAASDAEVRATTLEQHVAVLEQRLAGATTELEATSSQLEALRRDAAFELAELRAENARLAARLQIAEFRIKETAPAPSRSVWHRRTRDEPR